MYTDPQRCTSCDFCTFFKNKCTFSVELYTMLRVIEVYTPEQLRMQHMLECGLELPVRVAPSRHGYFCLRRTDVARGSNSIGK